MEYFPLSWDNSEGYMNWKNANGYFVLAMAFGMIDSLGKNLTLRTWNAQLNNTTQRRPGATSGRSSTRARTWRPGTS